MAKYQDGNPNELAGIFTRAGADPKDLKWMCQPVNATSIVDFVHERRGIVQKNRFERSVDDTLAALRLAVEEEGWKIGQDDFARLAQTAPAWPQARETYRSLRIRFGEGNEGVRQTFEAHARRIKRVFGEQLWRFDLLRSDPDCLRLYGGRDSGHHPTVEWVTIDLNANRQRSGAAAVRGPDSLADEGLILAWLFPERLKACDAETFPSWILAGYECRVPEDGAGEWPRMPLVEFHTGAKRPALDTSHLESSGSCYSVPRLL